MEIGAVVAGRFRVLARAGSGAFGTVYRVHDEHTHADAALKIFDGEHADLSRFEREVELLATLKHPRIVGFVAHGFTEAGTAYLAMEWLQGCDLAEKLEEGALSYDDSLHLILRVAEALATAHARGVVHRDIKPNNLFLVGRRPDQVRLLDFGIARREEEAAKLTRTGAIVGTPGYMAPELICGASELSPAADIFSLGCVLFECVVGAPAFVGPNAHAVLARVVSDSIPRLSRWLPGTPPGLDALVARMMARDPFERFADASAAALAISDVLSDPNVVPLAERESAAIAREPARTISTLFFAAETGIAAPLVQAIAAFGGQVRHQDETTIVATIALDNAPETVRRAVFCARAVLSKENRLQSAIVSSREEAGAPVSGVVQRALSGVSLVPGRILVDSTTASLLGQSFEVHREGTIAWLAAGPDAVTRSDSLHLGRARELALLDGSYQAGTEEQCSRLALVTGDTGIGKSRLLQALAERLAARVPAPTILFSHADTPTRTSPFEILRMFIRARHAELLQAGRATLLDALVARGMSAIDAEALAHMASSGPDEVTSGMDPLVAADRMRCAWLAFLEVELATSPLVLLAEDVHVGDAASIRLLGVAIERLRDRPLFVIASARTEAEPSVLDPWNSLEIERIELKPLRPQVAAELVRCLEPDAQLERVESIVARSGGNPLRLRELLRISSAEGNHLAAGTFDASLHRLPSSTARAIRCGSVFGLRLQLDGGCSLARPEHGSG